MCTYLADAIKGHAKYSASLALKTVLHYSAIAMRSYCARKMQIQSVLMTFNMHLLHNCFKLTRNQLLYCNKHSC